MRELQDVRLRAAALKNDKEKMGKIAIPIDLAFIKIWGFATTRSGRKLGREYNNLPPDGEKLHQDDVDNIFNYRLNKFGKNLVRYTNAQEHYVRFKDKGGDQYSPKDQFAHRLYVAAEAIQDLSRDTLGREVSYEQAAWAVINAADTISSLDFFDKPNIKNATVAGSIIYFALDQLAQESEGNGN